MNNEAYYIRKKSELGRIRGILVTIEGVAPTVERWTPNPTVAGSNPVGLIFFTPFYFIYTLYIYLWNPIWSNLPNSMTKTVSWHHKNNHMHSTILLTLKPSSKKLFDGNSYCLKYWIWKTEARKRRDNLFTKWERGLEMHWDLKYGPCLFKNQFDHSKSVGINASLKISSWILSGRFQITKILRI